MDRRVVGGVQAPPEVFRAAYDAEAFRRAAHEVVDRLADYLARAKDAKDGMPVLLDGPRPGARPAASALLDAVRTAAASS